MIPYPPRISTSFDIPGISTQQLAFLLLDTREALYGGAAGGGKSEALLLGATQDVDDWPTASLLLRRTYRDLDKPGGLMYRARQWFKGTRAHWDGINYRWTFPSGATLNFGFIDHEGDELKFQSSEYQYVGFDELTHFPEHQYLYLHSRLRRLEGTPVKLRLRGGTNPGGPGHEWVRKRFNLPHGTHHDSGRVFISANLYDNPFLKSEEYVEGLEQLGDVTRAQLLHGDWTATSSGGYFDVSKFRVVGWDEVPQADNIAMVIRYWDFAATEKSELDPDPDYTVGLKVLVTLHGSGDPLLSDFYVLDVERFRCGPGEVESRVKAVAKKDGPRVTQWLEQERGSAGKHFTNHYARNVLPDVNVRPLYATGDKVTKAKIAAARVTEGRVFLVDGPWVADFIAETGVFPLGSHDDQVDALSNAMMASEKERTFLSQGDVLRRGTNIRPLRRTRDTRHRSHYGY